MPLKSPRILVIKLWALGDVVLATPLVMALRAKYPNAHITWLADVANAGVLCGCPEIDDVIALDIMEWRRYYRKLRWGRFANRTREIRSQLFDRHFDIVLNLHADQWWATALNAGSETFGLFTKAKSPFRRFYTKSIASNRRLHFTRHQLLLAQLLECPDIQPYMVVGQLPDEDSFVRSFRQRNDLSDNSPIIVISPFSSKIEKDWPSERFSTLIGELTSKTNAEIILTHAPSELNRAELLANSTAARVTIASGTSLLEYVALLRSAEMVVCNDTSALHIAAAARTPVVALFGPTPPEETQPLAGINRIVTPSNGSKKMSDISVAQVLSAIGELVTLSRE